MTERLLAGACVLLALLAPVAVAVALDDALEAGGRVSGRDGKGWARSWWPWVVVAAVLRWFVVPHRIATVWIGYRWTQQVRELLPLPHYGAGSAAVYWLALSVLPPDHVSVMWVNAVLGVGLVVFAAALSARLSGPVAGTLTAALVAVLPLFVRNDTSDANNVPALLALLAGLVAWLGFLDRGRTASLVSAFLLATLAALSRPELLVLVPFAFGLVTWTVRPEVSKWREFLRDRRFVLGVVGWLSGAAMQAAHVASAAGDLKARSSLPGLSWDRLRELPRILRDVDVLVHPRLFAIVVTVVAAAALLFRASRRVAVAAWLVAAANLFLVVVDLDWANVARVQVPSALFVCVAASAGLAAAVSTWPGTRGAALVAGFALLVGWGSVAPVKLLWAPTNEEAEEQLIRKAIAALPSEPVTFARFTRDDRDTQKDPYGLTHHHFPDYWFAPPFRNDRVVGLRALLASNEPAGAYVLMSYRCHTLFRRADQPPPEGDGLIEACRDVRAKLELAPVFEDDAPNHGDVWLNYFPTAQSFRLGLYKVTGRKSDAAPTGSP